MRSKAPKQEFALDLPQPDADIIAHGGDIVAALRALVPDGVVSDAATVCPTETSRATTVPSTGETMTVWSRLSLSD